MKKIQTKLALAVLLVWSFSFIFSLFSSCEVGLGASVDTEAPEITIENPPVGAVIRDVFALSGHWNDDGAISGISVTLKRTDGKGKSVEISGSDIQWKKAQSGEDQGTWRALIDYDAKNLKDGSYQAIVAIKDMSSHKITQSTTFTIDNTPPLMILSRPATKASSDIFDSYGRTITLEGKAADDNEVSLIEVKVYKDEECTEELSTVELKNVPLTIEQYVAEYVDVSADCAYNDIYGTEDHLSDGSAQRYCKMNIYDGAQRYPADGSEQTEDDLKGNCTQSYYLNSEIESALQNNEITKITDFYHILNKTYESKNDSAVQEIENIFEQKKVTKSKFSINPNNNPKFVVTSRNAWDPEKYTSLDDVDFQLTAGNSYLEVEITPGLDKKEIIKDSVGVNLLLCDKFGNIDNSAEPVVLIAPGAANHAVQAEIVQSGSTYKYKTKQRIEKNSYNVNTGKYYLVQVTGYDSQGEINGKIVCDKDYAFKLVDNGEIIELYGQGVPEYISTKQESWIGSHASINAILSWKGGEAPYKLCREGKTGAVANVSSATNVGGELKWTYTESFTYSQLKALAPAGKEFPETLNYYIQKNDNEDRISTTATINLKYDGNDPYIDDKNIIFQDITDSENPKNAVVRGSGNNLTYYIRNKTGSKFKISGIATDDTGIENVVLSAAGNTYTAESSRFDFSSITFPVNLTGLVSGTITATDKAGNKSVHNLNFIIDNTPPTGNHAVDASSKDLYVRIGENPNDDITESNSLWDDDLDKDVGGKYGNGTFGSTTSIQIRGNFTDEGSGLAKIYYKVFETEQLYTNETALEELKQDVIDNHTGIITPLSNPETRRVFYNVNELKNNQGQSYSPKRADDPFGGTQFTSDLNSKGYFKFWKEIQTNYKDSISGLKEGSNYLVLVAEDNVGNTAVDYAMVNYNGENTKFINYSLNVHQTPPSEIKARNAQGNIFTGIIYTNGTDVPSLWGTVSDKSSSTNSTAGLKSLVITRDGENTVVNANLRDVRKTGANADPASVIALANADPSLKVWEADISTLLPSESKTVSLTAIATDSAGSTGNSTSCVIATITVDKTEPQIVIDAESPSDADSSDNIVQVNGIISLMGTAEDENGVDSVKGLYYKTYTDSVPQKPATNTLIPDNGTYDGWKKVSASSSGTSNWKFTNIVTNKLDGTTAIADKTKVCFTVAIKDRAGNIGYSNVKSVVVDQDTDRPVIRFSTMSLASMSSSNLVWLNSGDLTGTITDDDGAIDYVKIIAKDNSLASVPSESEWNAAANKYANGIWSYRFDSDGPKKLYFRVKEADKDGRTGKIFTSNVSSTTYASYGPKILDSNSVKFGYIDAGSTEDDIIYLKVDTQAPVLEKLYYSTSNVLWDNPATNANLVWKEADTSIIPDKFGGTNKYLFIKYRAYDTNGIDSITPKFGGTDVIEGKTVEISQAGQENRREFISCFNIENIESGLTKLEINIKDKAAANIEDATGEIKNYEAIVDNTEPEISISNYTSGQQVYGSSAVTLRGSTSDSNTITKVEFALNKIADAVPVNGWQDITDESNITYTSKLGWQIVFDDKITEPDSSSYHSNLLKKALFDLYNVQESAQPTYDTIQKVYVWLRATDELGNCGTTTQSFYFNVIPNGDRPLVEITYPSDEASVGGTIRITGSTEIQDVSASVENVYIQIDPSYDGSTFNENWASELKTLMNEKSVVSYQIKEDIGGIIGKGIPSQGNSKLNWFLNINGNREFNGKVDNENRKIAIRAYAISSTGKITCSDIVQCEIDPDAPTFGQTNELRFVQYSDAGLTVESASRSFQDGVYLKGQWYLVGSTEDDSGIRQITVDGTNIVWTTGADEHVVDNGSGWAVAIPGPNKYKNYNFKIPVGNTTPDQFGKINYEIIVTDGSESQIQNSQPFTVYYDNKAPEFEAESGNGKTLEVNGRIYQSNGSYTVRGFYEEPSNGGNNQSGFKRIAMFFTRERINNGTKELYLLDSMIDGGNNGTENFIKLGTVNNSGVVTYTNANFSKKDGLYWYRTTASIDNNELTISENALFTNKTIRAGGICMVDNVMYRIVSINGNKVTLDNSDGSVSDSTGKYVYFAYAQIIDNLSQESGKTVVYSSSDIITNGDGDCMVEGVQFSGGQYLWNASLDSSNMLDGNVKMSFVAYDAAGNYTERSIDQKVSNNAPRIAGVRFGTDTNLDNNISDFETVTRYDGVFTNVVNVKDGKTYNGQDENGEWITEYTIPETVTVKGALKVCPMIVGGNTGLGWQYAYRNKSKQNKTTTVTEYGGVGHSNDGSVRTSDLTVNITLKDFLNINIDEGTQDLKFIIWDKTDGSTLGNASSGSAKAEITLPVNIIISDSSAPTAVVNPFFWKNAEENSVYLNNPKNGHIELEDELPSGFTTGGSGVNDRDAKVSGKITFVGEATDNVIVQILKAKIPGYNSGNEFVIAQRDSSAIGWTSAHLYYKNAEGTVLSNASLDDSDWVFELLDNEYDENGKNIVTFKFHFNTEKIGSKAATNVSIQFTAVDKGSPALQNGNVTYANAKASTPGTVSTKTGALTGCYKVDVVPYITSVTTNLSSLKKNNPSVYARTAKGHYGVNVSEVLNIEGFNVSGGTLRFTKASGTVDAAYNANAGGTGVGGYKIPATAKSGNLSVIVNSVESLNNRNANDAKGSYTGTVNLALNPTGKKEIYENYYNRQPNGDNNNILTDDVVLDIWQFKDAGISQTSGYITEPIMKVNPKNGILNFGFNSGPANYCMANGQSTSYTTWVGNYARFSTCGFTVDENGNTHGITVGLDTNPGNSGSAGRMTYLTNLWGQGQLDTNGNYDGKNESRIDDIGAPTGTYNGVTFNGYVFIEDRFASPSLTTAVHGNDTYVFIAYYDDLNGEIRFKWGNVSSATIDTTLTYKYNNQNRINGDVEGGNRGYSFNQFADQTLYLKADGTNYVGIIDHVAFDSNKKPEYFSSIATSSTTAKSGNYVSIDLIKGSGIADDVIVATWYDASNNSWYYSYKKSPCNDNDMGVNPSVTPTDGDWRKPVLLASEAGENCQIAVDKAGGIHIASYDGSNADLLYAYLSSYDDSTPQVVTVDAYAFTGTNIRLDTAVSDDGNYIIPYIGYYMSSTQKPKMAYLPGVISLSATKAVREAVTIVSGTDETEAVTGLWETAIIPSLSRFADNYAYSYVNIGLWKDASTGKAKLMTGTDTAYSNQSGLGKTNTSKTYGNGTANPVLAYATRVGTRGHLETAQMK